MKRSDIINFLIKEHNLKSYLEIGLNDPNLNFNLINCMSKESCDPYINDKYDTMNRDFLSEDIKRVLTYHMTSDEMFKINNKKYDLIFIDGLHEQIQVGRDIINSLKHLNSGGYVVIHDCLPISENSQIVPRIQNEWNGDVWKAIPKLSKQNISYEVIDTDYGVGVIKYCDNYNDLVFDEEKSELDYKKDFINSRNQLMNVITEADFYDKYKKKIGVITHTNYSLDYEYIEEFCEYYLNKLKIDKIVLIDDYHNQQYHLSDIPYVKQKINEGKIVYNIMTNHLNQHQLIPQLYSMYKNMFDWIYFADTDEFLCIDEFGYNTLNEYIDKLPPNAEVIQFPWRLYTDNEQLHKSDGNVQDRFNIAINDPDNIECKVMVKGGLNDMSFYIGHIAIHRPNILINYNIPNSNVYFSDFTPITNFSPFHNPNHYQTPYIKHYAFKSTEEFVKRKIQGRLDMPERNGKTNLMDYRNFYFKHNKRTTEKENIFNSYLK